jgi:murein DD-endopeptidase MepM/ murein hydrolase activator NlpD
MCSHLRLPGWVLSLALAAGINAQTFRFPTANRALLEPGRASLYFAPTPGKTWTAGTFGFVRSDGRQLHEGIDIRCLRYDAGGEPADEVLASAPGTVSYLNLKAELSNYGIYVILRHQVEGLEVYTLYAHLRQISAGLSEGSVVRSGERLGIMGRTSNTSQRISKDRAHLHFEIALLLNDRFAEWQRRTQPGERNDHGRWNGRNLVGLDPAAILKESGPSGTQSSLLQHIRNQRELCRVLLIGRVPQWVRRYPALAEKNSRADANGIGGYELVLNACGLPFRFIPRSAAELSGRRSKEVLSVNQPELQAHPGQRLLAKRKGQWDLSHHGAELIDLICY